MKLHVPAFGIACGLIWGLGVFVLTWWMMIFATAGPAEPTFIGRIYLGYTVSGAGSVIGLVWGLLDGFFGGLVFAWLYNLLIDRLDGVFVPDGAARKHENHANK